MSVVRPYPLRRVDRVERITGLFGQNTGTASVRLHLSCGHVATRKASQTPRDRDLRRIVRRRRRELARTIAERVPYSPAVVERVLEIGHGVRLREPEEFLRGCHARGLDPVEILRFAAYKHTGLLDARSPPIPRSLTMVRFAGVCVGVNVFYLGLAIAGASWPDAGFALLALAAWVVILAVELRRWPE